MHAGPGSTIDIPFRSGPMLGWRVSFTAENLLLWSPPGWQADQSPAMRRIAEAAGDVSADQDVTLYSLPRSWVSEVWKFGTGEERCRPTEWDEDAPTPQRAVKPANSPLVVQPDDATEADDAATGKRGPGRPRRVPA